MSGAWSTADSSEAIEQHLDDVTRLAESDLPVSVYAERALELLNEEGEN